MQRLGVGGTVRRISSVWQSHAVGSEGPDFLNVAVDFAVDAELDKLKHEILHEIESALGRLRKEDRNVPRTIDIDVIMQGRRPLLPERWAHAFVIVPMAELLPEFEHPLTGRPLAEEAVRAKAATWMRRRPAVLAVVPEPRPD